MFCIRFPPSYTKSVIFFPRQKRHLPIIPFPRNCLMKTTCRVSLDSRGCILHQLPDRFRSRCFSDISSLNPPLSIGHRGLDHSFIPTGSNAAVLQSPQTGTSIRQQYGILSLLLTTFSFRHVDKTTQGAFIEIRRQTQLGQNIEQTYITSKLLSRQERFESDEEN